MSRFFSELNTNLQCLVIEFKMGERGGGIISLAISIASVSSIANLSCQLFDFATRFNCGGGDGVNLDVERLREIIKQSNGKYLRISLARLTASRLRLTKRRRIMFDRTDVTSLDRRILAPVSATSRAAPPLPPNFRTVLVTGQIFEYLEYRQA